VESKLKKVIFAIIFGLSSFLLAACSSLNTNGAVDLFLTIDKPINFSDDIAGGSENGWSPSPDSGGTWSAGDLAFIQLKYENKFENGMNLKIRMSSFVNENNPSVALLLKANDIEVNSIQFNEKKSGGDYVVFIGSEILAKSPGNIKLEFQITNAAVPKDLGVSEDLRKLGIFLIQITPSQV
jgi:hypothetical protein